jgi:AraC-like DNA-binding protein
MIFLVGLIIACFLFMLLLLKENKEAAHYILMAWIGVMMVHIALIYSHFAGIDFQYPQLLGLTLPLPLLHGVLLYAYTLELTEQKPIPVSWFLLHLLPFFTLCFLEIPFFQLSNAQKIAVFQQKGQGFEWFMMIQFVAIIISGFTYSIASIVRIQQNRRNMQEMLSNTDHRMLGWLEFLAIGLGLIWCLAIFFDDEIIFSAVTFFVLMIGFWGIHQAPVFNNFLIENAAETPKQKRTETNTTEIRYAKSGLQTAAANEIMAQLEQLMRSEKPYKNPELTLPELAQRLHIPPNQLSQAINSGTQNSFYQYINTWRIEAFLIRAAAPENQHFTYLAIAFDCGFNSKTTFNKYFKLKTGKTPSEYFNT